MHEAIEIKYFYEGTATLLIGTNTVSVKAGDIVVINPYEFHATVDRGVKGGKYHLFMVPLDFFANDSKSDLNLRSLLLVDKNLFKTHIKDERMSKILLRIVQENADKQPFYNTAVKGLLMEFFCLMLRNYTLNKDTSDTLQKDTLRSYKLIEPALRHIRDNFAEPFTVDMLANFCGLSKHYFCRVFKTVTGKTAMEYLRDYRIKVSDAMLTNTDKSINQISEQCGFESVNYYCRCYKAHYGFSPSKRRAKGDAPFESLP
ncbi:MAG: helix-turn-helix transcriptional regulator [Clostridia bacterium]|nr:helix-turn-helix transcriptional regulator [Clostridia bacterium]